MIHVEMAFRAKTFTSLYLLFVSTILSGLDQIRELRPLMKLAGHKQFLIEKKDTEAGDWNSSYNVRSKGCKSCRLGFSDP